MNEPRSPYQIFEAVHNRVTEIRQAMYPQGFSADEMRLIGESMKAIAGSHRVPEVGIWGPMRSAAVTQRVQGGKARVGRADIELVVEFDRTGRNCIAEMNQARWTHSPAQRYAFFALRFCENVSLADAAKILKIPVTTLKTWEWKLKEPIGKRCLRDGLYPIGRYMAS